jgi:uridine phosphorylase
MGKKSNNSKMYFTGLDESMLAGAKYAVLPGDPKRAEVLAEYLDNNFISERSNRQYSSYIANISGGKVLITSTGMGCPAISVAVKELARLGIKYFIRVGTSGAIQDNIELGDIVISRAAVKLDGVSSQCVPLEYPAVASFDFTQSFIEGAKSTDIPYHVGITVSSDTFWPGQERYDNYSGYLLRKFKGSMDEWKALNVTNFEMEASALFTLCSLLNLDAVCFCGIIAKRTDSEKVDLEGKTKAQENWKKVLKAGLLLDMKKRNFI